MSLKLEITVSIFLSSYVKVPNYKILVLIYHRDQYTFLKCNHSYLVVSYKVGDVVINLFIMF